MRIETKALLSNFMSRYTIDACILLATYVKEKYTDQAREFFINSLQRKDAIVNPSLFYYEILSNLLKYRLGDEIINHAKQYIENTALIIPDSKIETLAMEIVNSGNEKSGYPHFYDAIYHATAIINHTTFITLDSKHYEKSKHFGNIELL